MHIIILAAPCTNLPGTFNKMVRNHNVETFRNISLQSINKADSHKFSPWKRKQISVSCLCVGSHQWRHKYTIMLWSWFRDKYLNQNTKTCVFSALFMLLCCFVQNSFCLGSVRSLVEIIVSSEIQDAMLLHSDLNIPFTVPVLQRVWSK